MPCSRSQGGQHEEAVQVLMQVFAPTSVLMLKVGALAPLGGASVAILLWRSIIAPRPAIGEPVEQVVPFSHKHHAGDDGIDCRYCHQTVETTATAGMPSTQTCMNCHSQLWSD